MPGKPARHLISLSLPSESSLMPLREHPPIPRKEKISVSFLILRLRKLLHIDLKPLAAEHLCEERFVTETDLHRPGLALAGYIELFTHQRIQVIGNSETQYMNHIGKESQEAAFGNITRFDIPVIFLTDNNVLPPRLLEMATEAGIPIFTTPVETTRFMFLLRDFLEDQFAPQTMVHGSMVDVYGIGILIAGKSGIGKSEVALDLVERGHRLVADDVVIITKKSNVLMATATDLNKHFMEIRGLGIVDVLSMFGIRSVRYQKRLEIILDLYLWDEETQVDRTGLDRNKASMLGLDIPIIHLPITPGKNITVIAEVIAMNHLLTNYGYDAAEEFQNKIKNRIASKARNEPSIRRSIEYFEGDLE
ncbi:MAG: HPr(Ser) kinase/phosphatase [Balneolales bacterium]